jgi:cell division topological specificity factor
MAVIGKHVPVEPEKVHVRMDRGQMMSTLAIDIEIPSLASAPA